METFFSARPWTPRMLNRSGIRRLKIVDEKSVNVIPGGIVPLGDLVLYEFIFPADLSCQLVIQAVKTAGGSSFYRQTVSFSLPHFSDEIWFWIDDHYQKRWILIAEDYNHVTRLLGGYHLGHAIEFQGSTGAGPKDSNPMNFTLSADQLKPFKILPAYDDTVLFPEGGFSYGFSTGFNS